MSKLSLKKNFSIGQVCMGDPWSTICHTHGAPLEILCSKSFKIGLELVYLPKYRIIV